MKRAIPIACLLLLGGCSIFSHEKVDKSYVGPAALDQSQVTQLLAQQGYTDINGLHKNGDDWIGSAKNRDGRQVNFDIGKSGTVRER